MLSIMLSSTSIVITFIWRVVISDIPSDGLFLTLQKFFVTAFLVIMIVLSLEELIQKIYDRMKRFVSLGNKQVKVFTILILILSIYTGTLLVPFINSIVAPGHMHGNIDVCLKGEDIDLSKSKYQNENAWAHLEGGNGELWHNHAPGISLEFLLKSIRISITDSSVQTPYKNFQLSNSRNILIRVNGETVVPSSYILQDGDNVTVTSNDSMSNC